VIKKGATQTGETAIKDRGLAIIEHSDRVGDARQRKRRKEAVGESGGRTCLIGEATG